MSGTVGTGNIAGVALAVHMGGPAALFWMLVTAAVGMTTKFVEVTLSHKYRTISSDGHVSGGPMYVMQRASFSFMGKRVNLGWLAALFAIATVISCIGTGNMPQINSIASSMNQTMGIAPWLTGAVLSVLLGLVIIGGIKRIAKVTTRLVPAMAVIYLIGALAVLFVNYQAIIPSFLSIFEDIFTPVSAVGGFLGAGVALAFNYGVGRGLYSNEAGQGSAPIAHAAARAEEPLSEGMVAILEPFIDTIIICTLTGITLLASGAWHEKYQNTFESSNTTFLAKKYDDTNPQDKQLLFKHLNQDALPTYEGSINVNNGKIEDNISVLHARSIGEDIKITKDGKPYTGALSIKDGRLKDSNVELSGLSLLRGARLTTKAFENSLFGPFGQYIVSIGLLLFAFSTSISWSYYGGRAMVFLLGDKSVLYFRIAYVVAFFIGALSEATIVWNFAGVAIALMTIPNLVSILWLRKEMPKIIKEYGTYFKKEFAGHKHPKF